MPEATAWPTEAVTPPADLRRLLRGGESDLPLVVRRTVSFMQRRDVWFAISRNPPARSCRDAAHKRWRLGHRGIPLWDEFKSYLGWRPHQSPPALVVIHCRGDRELDMDRVANALGADEPPRRLRPDELAALGLDYGLVNPFAEGGLDAQVLASRALQVFDTDLLTPVGTPGTVMTNAGDITWAVEFHALELCEAIDHKIVADISTPLGEEQARLRGNAAQRPAIGLITGNPPDAGYLLAQRLNVRVRLGLGRLYEGDVSLPRIVLHSLPALAMAVELRARRREIRDALCRAAEEMCRSDGVHILAVACNSADLFASDLEDICAKHDVTYVSIAQAVADRLRAERISHIALLGLPEVADMGESSPYSGLLDGIEVEQLSERGVRVIRETVYQVKRAGAEENGLNRLRSLLHQEVKSDHVVIAVGELSLLLEQQKRPGRTGKTIIDWLDAYADELARQYLGGHDQVSGVS
jgi:aspartate/glutamate racemase